MHNTSKTKVAGIQNLSGDFKEDIMQYFAECGIFQDLLEVGDDFMVTLYALAHQAYQNNKYKEATQMFSVLCMMNHLERKYWLGLGASLQMEKKYTSALECYGLAVLLNYKEPDAHLYTAECMLALGNKEEVKSVLRGMIELCVQKEHASIKEKAKNLLSILK
jgi:type III secretion system low calcium response chaperone LcrH/SycD